jgi:hypothetical protein
MKQAAPQARHGSVNAGSDPDTQPDATYGRAPAVIIQIRLRAGAAILGRLGTRPAVHTESPAPDSARVHNGRSGAHDFHPPRRRSKALLRRECRSRVTHDHPRSPRNPCKFAGAVTPPVTVSKTGIRANVSGVRIPPLRPSVLTTRLPTLTGERPAERASVSAARLRRTRGAPPRRPPAQPALRPSGIRRPGHQEFDAPPSASPRSATPI